MPYIGAKVRHKDEMVTIKVCGTEKLFLTSPSKLQDIVSSAVEAGPFDDEPVVGIAKIVAEALYENENVLWVECEILNADGTIYGNTVTLLDA